MDWRSGAKPEAAFYAARSATTASSTGQPLSVTRRLPLGSVSTKPMRLSSSIWLCCDLAAAQRGEAFGVDAFAQAKAHHQQLVAFLFPGEDVVGGHAVAARRDLLLPLEGQLLDRGGVALAIDQQAAMRARADAGIFAVAPVDEVVDRSPAPAGRGWKSRRPAGRRRGSDPASARRNRRSDPRRAS